MKLHDTTSGLGPANQYHATDASAVFNTGVSRLHEVGAGDGWRCWLCDEPVDPEMSVNDARGPSVDSGAGVTRAKTKRPRPGDGSERLAHRGCNTRKGAISAVVPWSDGLFVVDPAPIIASVERLQRKGGREVMARCPTRADGEEAAQWLVDRLSRLCPDLPVTTEIQPGGGQYLLVLRS
jgi:hypothetical protein